MNFSSMHFVEPSVSNNPKSVKAIKPPQQRPGQPGSNVAANFSFGARQYTSRGPRRLIVPQKCLISPVFEIEAERSRSILRVVSSCA